MKNKYGIGDPDREYVVEEVCEDGVLRTRAERLEHKAYAGLRSGSVVHEFEQSYRRGPTYPDGGYSEWREPRKVAENHIL